MAHRPGCRHCQRVRALARDFQAWRASWEAQLESVAVGYASEAVDFRAANPAPTFRTYLEGMAS